MADTVNLRDEAAIITSQILLIESVWEGIFSKFGTSYDDAFATVSSKITSAQDSNRDAVISIISTVFDLVKAPFAIYGEMASVVISALGELSANTPIVAIGIESPSPNKYSQQLLGMKSKIFTPIKAAARDLTIQASKQGTMDRARFKRIRSQLLMSPVWWPPTISDSSPITKRIEIALWCSYFYGLSGQSVASHKLRYISDIMPYIIDDPIIPSRDTQGWSAYPTPISQGGPGDWSSFLQKTARYWKDRTEWCVAHGWLAPIPEIPDHAKAQNTPNWTPPTPSKGGGATVTIVSVDMTVMPKLDWKDVPALRADK